MKKYIYYRIGLLMKLLGLNILSSCVNTRQTLGINWTESAKKVMVLGSLVQSATGLPVASNNDVSHGVNSVMASYPSHMCNFLFFKWLGIDICSLLKTSPEGALSNQPASTYIITNSLEKSSLEESSLEENEVEETNSMDAYSAWDKRDVSSIARRMPMGIG